MIPVKYRLCGAFSLPKTEVFPLVFPSQIQNALYEAVHAVRAVLLHAFGKVAVSVQRESRCRVPKVALDSFYIVPGPDCVHRVCVPLRYNYDKPEKPRISRVFGYLARFFILFQTEKSSREVVIS